MKKTFTVTGLCVPERNYMVDLSDRVKQIEKEYIAPGKYFTINRARQYENMMYRIRCAASASRPAL